MGLFTGNKKTMQVPGLFDIYKPSRKHGWYPKAQNKNLWDNFGFKQTQFYTPIVYGLYRTMKYPDKEDKVSQNPKRYFGTGLGGAVRHMLYSYHKKKLLAQKEMDKEGKLEQNSNALKKIVK